MLQRVQRLPTRVLVHVRTPGGEFKATITNLSLTGARLLGVPERGLKVADMIEIRCLGRIQHAKVRWLLDDTCGLMFANPLDEHQIAAILASGTVP